MELSSNEAAAKAHLLLQSLRDVDQILEPLQIQDLKSLQEKLCDLESATLQVSLAYSLAVLYLASQNLQGGPRPDHAIFQEIARIQSYTRKISQAKNPAPIKKRSIVVDREAARRVIRQSLSEDNN